MQAVALLEISPAFDLSALPARQKREKGEENKDQRGYGERPDNHRFYAGAKLVSINNCAHSGCLFIVVHKNFFKGRLFD